LTGKARQQDIMLRNMLANVFRRLIIADPFPVAQCDIADIFINLFALFAFTPLLGSGNPALVFVFLLLGLSLMGLTFGPMGALLP
ncbi:hypothetical protein MJN85_29630, partial [Salmonella enterica subsp. enterica serovar Anatum]|nr:hypothetical protein [Salmonella enterica subsp. enterica serovar Anatum]